LLGQGRPRRSRLLRGLTVTTSSISLGRPTPELVIVTCARHARPS
jgi:hypothetical protein